MRQTRCVTAITVDRVAGITAGLDELPDALGLLRGRLLALAEGLPPDQWAGPSRCHRWTRHQVLRHVRDACRLHARGLRRDPDWPFDHPFDNRTTPDVWLASSAGEAIQETLDDLRRWSLEEGPALVERLESPDQHLVRGPYGPIPWTVLSMHVLWDGWLHERDIAQTTGGGVTPSSVDDGPVATYALFIASMAAVLKGEPLDATVTLTGHGRHYVAAVRPGHVELHTESAPPTSDLHGALDAVVDSLAGRGPHLEYVLDGDPAKREPLTWLRAMLAPIPAP